MQKCLGKDRMGKVRRKRSGMPSCEALEFLGPWEEEPGVTVESLMVGAGLTLLETLGVPGEEGTPGVLCLGRDSQSDLQEKLRGKDQEPLFSFLCVNVNMYFLMRSVIRSITAFVPNAFGKNL